MAGSWMPWVARCFERETHAMLPAVPAAVSLAKPSATAGTQKGDDPHHPPIQTRSGPTHPPVHLRNLRRIMERESLELEGRGHMGR